MSKESRQTLLTGITATTGINADGTGVDFEIEYVEPPDIETPLTCYLLRSDDSGRQQAWTYHEGWPTAGPHPEVRFLDAPILAVSPTGHSLSEPVLWDLYDTGVHVALMITINATNAHWLYAGPDGTTLRPVEWMVQAPDDATELTVPEPPSTVTLEELFGTTRLIGFVQIWQPAPDGTYNTRIAISAKLGLEP